MRGPKRSHVKICDGERGGGHLTLVAVQLSGLAGPMSTPALIATAADRLFRVYEAHSRSPGPDTLFAVLTAMHSLNDRLKRAKSPDFEFLEEFSALRALRNFAHHEAEIEANVRVVPSPATSELAFVCVVRRDQVERAIEAVGARWRDEVRNACKRQFHWYGEAVNINPCLFNFMVHAYEHLAAAGAKMDSPAMSAFDASYQFEACEGHAHFIDGRLTGVVGDIEQVLTALVGDLPSR